MASLLKEDYVKRAIRSSNLFLKTRCGLGFQHFLTTEGNLSALRLWRRFVSTRGFTHPSATHALALHPELESTRSSTVDEE